MVRLLAVSDEEFEGAYRGRFSEMGPDVIVACGDLPFDYLEYLVTVIGKPLAYVLGNHDPAAGARPEGCINVDEKVIPIAGLRIAGLGGSHRYRPGPNQYTQKQMKGRARRLLRKSRVPGRGPRIDVLLTHAPPHGVGDDQDDPCHRGFEAFHQLVALASPRLLIHGHIHSHGIKNEDRRLGSTQIVNAVGYRLLEVAS
jgi:Icc-related predicted phosphoesterase